MASLRIFLSVPLIAAAASARAGDFDLIAGIASIIDADTLEFHGTRIRLAGIDAPESRQLCQGTAQAEWDCSLERIVAFPVATVHGLLAKLKLADECGDFGNEAHGWPGELFASALDDAEAIVEPGMDAFLARTW